MSKVWLITGSSEGGIGAGIARAILEAGEKVAVTARNIAKVESIVHDFPETAYPVTLDVTDSDSIDQAINNILEHFGTIDVLVNNAGYCYRASVEESDEEEVRKMFEANFFGLVNLTKKVLPIMRKKQNGTIVNFSSIAALRANPASAFYAATKAAVELMSSGLKREVEPLGIRVIVVEPGAFRTNFFGTSMKGAPMTIPAYKDTAWPRYPQNAINKGDQAGDPKKAGIVLQEAVNSEKPPFRLLLSQMAIDVATQEYETRLQEIDDWRDKSILTDYES